MLSIGKVCAANAGYYVRLSRVDDYYRENSEPGRWWGDGLGSLGIAAGFNVKPKQFRSLLRGFHPETGERLVQNAGVFDPKNKRSRRAGHDLCFSAPKSVSLLWAASDDATRDIILRAHQQAVDTALAEVQESASWTRLDKTGPNLVKTRGLLVAQFDHFSSRAGDVNLHTHCPVLNLAQARKEERFRALDTRQLFRPKRKLEWGALYRDALRERLGRDLQLAFRDTPERGTHTWEVRGIPQSVLDEHSTRRTQIRAIGYATAAEAAEVALNTRGPKLETASTRAELFEVWRDDLQSRHPGVFDLDRLQRERELEQPAHQELPLETSRETHETTPTVQHSAPEPPPKEVSTIPSVEESITRLDKARARLRETTSATLNALAPRPTRALTALCSTLHRLEMEQREAVRRIVRGSRTTHNFRELDNNSLVALSRSYEFAGFRFYTLSATRKRAEELRKAGVKRAMTIAGAKTALQPRTLTEIHLSRRGLASALWWPPGKTPPLQELWPRVMNRPTFPRWLDSKSVLFVESLNHPRPEDVAELKALAEKSRARIIFSGETFFHPFTQEEKRWFSKPPRLRDPELEPEREDLYFPVEPRHDR